MSNLSSKNTEIALTKELARRLSLKYPTFRIYSNKCPSRSPLVRNKWKQIFGQTCPPLQPEMDLIIWEPDETKLYNNAEKIRAVEIKYFTKNNGSINQSFYKGIEQSLALLQWGFDNVALWQFFDESLTYEDIRNYGCKTWQYVHELLKLPIDFTPFRIVGSGLSNIHFSVIQADWDNDLKPIQLLDIDNPSFTINWRHPNPLLLYPSARKSFREVSFLRQVLIKWLQNI